MYISKDGKIVVNHIPNKDIIKGYKTNEFIECDPLIAPVLAVLNNKGYFTEASCQGHTSLHIGYIKIRSEEKIYNYSMFYSNPYILFRNKVPYNNFIDENGECIIDGWNIEYVVDNKGGEQPVRFVNKLEEGDKVLTFGIRSFDIKDYNDYFKFTKSTISSIEKLYEFALNLPRRRGIKKTDSYKSIEFAKNFAIYLFDDEE